MTLGEYMVVLRRNWLIIALMTVGGLALGYTASALTTPLYSATAQVFVSVRGAGDEVGTAYTGGLFVQQRIASYTEIVGSSGVLEPVIDELDLTATPLSLSSQIEAVNPKNTVLIDVTATDTDPTQAAALANATAVSFGSGIQRLETTDAEQAPVKVTVTQPATVPVAPISPNTKLNLALGLFLGIGLGVSIAMLRHTLDTTVKSTNALAEAAGATVLGAVMFDPQAKARPLVALDQSSVRAEAFRTIRTNLQYVAVDRPPRVMVITSSLPGEGKSTTACNLAITLAQAGSRVLLVEADLRRPRIAEYLGIDGSVGLTDILIGKGAVSDVVVPWNRGLLDVMASGPIPPNPSELLGSHQMGQLLAELRDQYDAVLLDAPPLLPVTDAAVLASISDGALLLARHGETKREQVVHAAEALRQVNGRLLGVVINFVPSKLGRYGYGYGYGSGYGQGAGYGDADSRRAKLTMEEVSSAMDKSGADRAAAAAMPAGSLPAPTRAAVPPTAVPPPAVPPEATAPAGGEADVRS